MPSVGPTLFLTAFCWLSSCVTSQFYNVTVREWDRDFKKNKWSFIDRVAVERGRNSLITNIFYTLYGGGGVGIGGGSKLSKLLDVGCGEGVLSDFMVGPQRQQYFGVDVSAEAIKSARKRRSQAGPTSPTDAYFISPQQFQVASALEYIPPQGVTFGAIVFNEMLYYTDYSKVIQRFIPFLDPPTGSSSAAANSQLSDRREKGTPQSAAGSDGGVAGGQGGVIVISVWFSDDPGTAKMRDDIFSEARKHLDEVDFMDLHGVSRNGAGPNAVKRKVSFHIAAFKRRAA